MSIENLDISDDAIIGETRSARRAGTRLATVTAAVMRPRTPASVAASVGLIAPKTMLSIRRPSTNTAAIPTTAPMTASVTPLPIAVTQREVS